MPTTRRQILLGGASVAGAAALSPLLGTGASEAATASRSATVHATLPHPASAGIDHIVVLCMENRSFDHFLGWLPGANGRQAGLAYPDRTGAPHPTYHLTTYQGCGSQDPDHSYSGARASATPHRPGPPATTTTPPPSARPSPTGSTCTARRPTGSTTASGCPPCRRSGTTWRRPACPTSTTSRTCRSSGCGG
ncbi:MAG: hypothetical protein E6G35_00165 [Actinobacteria bacterium]|nr:MAG: hypothetical protein E6G35_00165 [Actinomycetota bacterium]